MDLQRKSVDWFLCDRDLFLEKVKTLNGFLISRKQRVVFNSHFWSWVNIRAAVPPGFIWAYFVFGMSVTYRMKL